MSNSLKHTEIDGESAGLLGNPNALTTGSTRHPDLWFDDGSIVLSVQMTLFRVHRTTLSKHSTVFADMFSIPQPLDQVTIEGCPVVNLPDSAADFAYLLKALYDPFYFAGSSADHPIPFDDIAGVLRLSSKYDIPTFRQKSIQELKKLFPCTLPDLDSVYPLTPRPKAYILMISLLLARECNVLELLPCIFYFTTHWKMELLVKCFTCLPRRELEICLVGREKMQMMHKPSLTPSQHCLNRASCQQMGLLILDAAISTNRLPYLDVLSKATWDAAFSSHCIRCIEDKTATYTRTRETVWNELPGYFGLGTWDELRNA